MRNRDLGPYVLSAVVALLFVAACGGTAETPTEPVKPAPTTPAPAASVEPPGDQDIDIEPGSISMGNVLSGTLTAADKLPPQAFGPMKDFKLENVESTTVDLNSISLYKSDTDYLTITSSAGSVQWTRTTGGATVTLTAYAPKDNGNNCALMSSNLKDYFKSGVSLSFNYGTAKTQGTGTLQNNGTVVPKIKFKTTPAAGTCAPP